MREDQTLLITGSEAAELLNIEDCISAVEEAFKLYAQGKTAPPGILGVHARDGGFHIKAGIMNFGARNYFAAKINANFQQNRDTGLPTIQGVIVLCDGDDGRILALMDSIKITIIRTGAATAVAAKYLARKRCQSCDDMRVRQSGADLFESIDESPSARKSICVRSRPRACTSVCR